jgi:hypothetical protein
MSSSPELTALNASKGSPRRKLANWFGSTLPRLGFDKLGLWLHNFCLTRAELREFLETTTAFTEALEERRQHLNVLLTQYPEAAVWFSEDLINEVPGRHLTVYEAAAAFDDFFDFVNFYEFFLTFVLDKAAYRDFMVFLYGLPLRLRHQGFIDDQGKSKPEDHLVIEQLVYNEVATTLARTNAWKGKYDEVREKIPSYLY